MKKINSQLKKNKLGYYLGKCIEFKSFEYQIDVTAKACL